MKVNYSFTQARKKHIFKVLTKIWVFYFLLIFFILFAFRALLHVQMSSLQETHSLLNDEQALLRGKIASLNLEYQRIQTELKILEILSKNNLNLKTQAENILNMIPRPVGLNQLTIENNSLYMSGITPSKEIFVNLMQLPLKTIFDTSDVSFNAIGNGWYNFQSVSNIEDSRGFEKRVKGDLDTKAVK